MFKSKPLIIGGFIPAKLSGKPTMHTLNLDLGDRSYPIYIDSGLFENEELFSDHIEENEFVLLLIRL